MRISDFHRLLAAEVVSNFGSMMSRLAIPWLATLALAVTPFEMGLLVVADVIAAAMGSLILGAAVDRMGKRAVMIVCDIARAGILGLLAWLAAVQHLAFWMLALAAAGSGLLTVMFELARSAWLAQQRDVETLPARNAQISAGGSFSETLAFALGGWLYQWLGAALALVIDAASYLVSALCLGGVREAAPSPRPRRRGRALLGSLIGETREGIAALLAVPTLRAIAAIEALVALAGSLTGTSYMIFVVRDVGFETGVLGMIFATGGIGSLAGAALAPRLGRRFGGGGAMLAGLALVTLGAACIPLANGATLTAAVLLVAHQVIGDGGRTAYDVHDRTLRQTSAGPEVLARVDAGIRTVGHFATLAGAVGGGLLATYFGARFALVLSAALFAAAALLTYVKLVAMNHRRISQGESHGDKT